MHYDEVQEIGRELKLRRLMSELRDRLRMVRPTISSDTVYRAFNEPESNSELLRVIREEGKRLLEGYATIAA